MNRKSFNPLDNIEGLIAFANQTLFIFYRRAGSMKNQVASEGREARAILYCRSAKSDNTELQEQKEVLDDYAKANGLTVVRTYMERGTMGALTYNNLRLQACYHEFDEMLITELAVLGNSSIEITEEISYLVGNGIKVLSIKDGELNIETLPSLFRKRFRLKNMI